MVVTKDNTIETRQIHISDSIEKNFLVEKGLAAGERIALEGVLKVRPGQPVRIDDGQPPVQGKAGAGAVQGK
jgi:membrane fusion protein (multidrug efflux system)